MKYLVAFLGFVLMALVMIFVLVVTEYLYNKISATISRLIKSIFQVRNCQNCTVEKYAVSSTPRYNNHSFGNDGFDTEVMPCSNCVRYQKDDLWKGKTK